MLSEAVTAVRLAWAVLRPMTEPDPLETFETEAPVTPPPPAPDVRVRNCAGCGTSWPGPVVCWNCGHQGELGPLTVTRQLSGMDDARVAGNTLVAYTALCGGCGEDATYRVTMLGTTAEGAKLPKGLEVDCPTCEAREAEEAA